MREKHSTPCTRGNPWRRIAPVVLALGFAVQLGAIVGCDRQSGKRIAIGEEMSDGEVALKVIAVEPADSAGAMVFLSGGEEHTVTVQYGAKPRMLLDGKQEILPYLVKVEVTNRTKQEMTLTGVQVQSLMGDVVTTAAFAEQSDHVLPPREVWIVQETAQSLDASTVTIQLVLAEKGRPAHGFGPIILDVAQQTGE